jgi:hypothetical protein
MRKDYKNEIIFPTRMKNEFIVTDKTRTLFRARCINLGSQTIMKFFAVSKV